MKNRITFRETSQEDEQIPSTRKEKIESIPFDETTFNSIELIHDLENVLTEEELEVCRILSQEYPLNEFEKLWGIKESAALKEKLNSVKSSLKEKLQFLIN